MANLYGIMKGNRGETTRCGSQTINATLKTWKVAYSLTVRKDGTAALAVTNLENGELANSVTFDAKGLHQPSQ